MMTETTFCDAWVHSVKDAMDAQDKVQSYRNPNGKKILALFATPDVRLWCYDVDGWHEIVIA